MPIYGISPPPRCSYAPGDPPGHQGVGKGAARYDSRHASGGAPALAHAPGGPPGTPWTLRGPQRVEKKGDQGN